MNLPTVIPVTDIKRKATAIIKEMAWSKRAILITQNGKAVAIMMDVETYRDMESQIEILQGIIRGQEDMIKGNVISHEDAKQRLSRFSKAGADSAISSDKG